MRHKLARQVCGYHFNYIAIKMEVKSKPLYDLFYITICHKIPLAWCQKNTPSDIFNYENKNCDYSSNP